MLTVTSTAFANSGKIPAIYCAIGVDGGSNVSPQLSWTPPPEGTRSVLVAIVDHHPVAHLWVHWVVIGLSPSADTLAEGISGSVRPPARELKNTSGRPGYSGPRPPVGSGDHDYVVSVYALDVERPDLPEQPGSADIERAVSGHTLASGTITGFFGR
ncbi:MAG: YbhB/YbcL family Raf kinase inhibitor-like protein [Actinomycetia bacterium]|nr:YbhB/YbcL family Raf kinase inhibitor-like protein [Actinomycetes bacterium]